MRGRKRVSDLNGDRHAFAQLHLSPRDGFAQRMSLYELSRDEMRVAFPPDLVNGEDVRVVEDRGRARFALESPHLRGVLSKLRRKEFERDLPVEPLVARQVNFA